MRRWILTLLLLVAGLAVLSDTAHSKPKRAFDELIVFGDSSVDAGNLNIFDGGIAASSPYFGGRFSNGPTWVEHLAEALGLGSTSEENPVPGPSLAGGTNYAFGGAQTGTDDLQNPCYVFPGGVQFCIPTVGTQIELFQADGRTLDGDELIVIASGYNDENGELAAREVAKHVETLYALGGRFFLIPNLMRASQPPGTTPDPLWDERVEHFDAEIQARLDELEATLDGITIFRLNLLALSDDMIENPQDYGLTNVTDSACPGCGIGVPEPNAEDTIVSNPEEYMWWDLIHPSATTHEVFGLAAADVVLK